MAAERRVVVLAYDGIQSLDLIGPVEVFDVASRHRITPQYRVEVVAPERRADRHDERDHDHAGARDRRRPQPGRHVRRRRRHRGHATCSRTPRSIDAVRRTARRSAPGRVASAPAPSSSRRRACSTAAGSPRTGRRCRRLARQYPELDVDPDPIFVRDGDVYTSAGVTAGHRPLPRARRRGPWPRPRARRGAPARRVPQAAGGQAQFSSHLSTQLAERDVSRRRAGLDRGPPRRGPLRAAPRGSGRP